MSYLLIQNDEPIENAETLKDAERLANEMIRQANAANKGSIIRPSQYVYIYKFMKSIGDK